MQKYQEELEKYEQIKQAYLLLVQQEIQKLHFKGVFEEQAQKYSKDYYKIDDWGNLARVSGQEYMEEYMGVKSVNDELGKIIMEQIMRNHDEAQKLLELQEKT